MLRICRFEPDGRVLLLDTPSVVRHWATTPVALTAGLLCRASCCAAMGSAPSTPWASGKRVYCSFQVNKACLPCNRNAREKDTSVLQGVGLLQFDFGKEGSRVCHGDPSLHMQFQVLTFLGTDCLGTRPLGCASDGAMCLE